LLPSFGRYRSSPAHIPKEPSFREIGVLGRCHGYGRCSQEPRGAPCIRAFRQVLGATRPLQHAPCRREVLAPMTVSADLEHQMREPCKYCGGQRGRVERKGAQDCVYCAACGRWSYNAPRSETGNPVAHLRTRHDISPSQRSRILDRDAHRCVLCGANAETTTELHIGHLISVHEREELGLTVRELQSDENLATFCVTCNLGLGKGSVSSRLIAALVHRRDRPTTPSQRKSSDDLSNSDSVTDDGDRK
jgi:5-methylcytosine-specific restriction endonuclease McrA